jgi:AraC family transcriptional regulator
MSVAAAELESLLRLSMNAHSSLFVSHSRWRTPRADRRVTTSSFDLGWPHVHARITDLAWPQLEIRGTVPNVHVVNYMIDGEIHVLWHHGRRVQELPLHRGDVAIVPGPQAGAVRFEGGRSRMLHWIIPSQLLAAVAAEEFGNRLPQIPLRPTFGCHDRSIAEYCACLAAELEQPDNRSPRHVEFLTRALAVHLVRCSIASDLPGRGAVGTLSAAKLRAAIDYVHDNLNWNLSLEAIAGATGDSPCHFARMFRRTTGKTPHQYVISQRIECAKRLLEAGELPISAIAVDTGFASQSHLTEVFRRVTGMTPKSFQDALRRSSGAGRRLITGRSGWILNAGK